MQNWRQFSHNYVTMAATEKGLFTRFKDIYTDFLALNIHYVNQFGISKTFQGYTLFIIFTPKIFPFIKFIETGTQSLSNILRQGIAFFQNLPIYCMTLKMQGI